MQKSIAVLIMFSCLLFSDLSFAQKLEGGYVVTGFSMDGVGEDGKKKGLPIVDLQMLDLSLENYDDLLLADVGKMIGVYREGEMTHSMILAYDALWVHDSGWPLLGDNGLGFRSRLRHVEDKTRPAAMSGWEFLVGPVFGGWMNRGTYGSVGAAILHDGSPDSEAAYSAMALMGNFRVEDIDRRNSIEGELVIADGEDTYRNVDISLEGTLYFDEGLPIILKPSLTYQYKRWIQEGLLQKREGVIARIGMGVDF